MVRVSVVPALMVCFSLVGQAPDPAQVKAITLKEALQVALQNNLSVTIAQESRTATQANIQIEEGVFDWNAAANVNVGHLKSGSSSSATRDSTSYLAHSDRDNYNRSLTAGVQKNFTWGGALDVSYAPTYSATKTRVTNVNGTLNGSGVPILDYTTATGAPYTGALNVKYSQNLLRGFGTAVGTAKLVVARKNAQAADYTYQLAVISLVSATETKYWEAVRADRNLVNQRTSLELAQKLLKENTIRVEVGTMAPIEITSAEAQVAQAEQNIIAGEAKLRNAQDALQRALYPDSPQAVTLKPTDAPDLPYLKVDEAGAVKMALARRLELKRDKLDQESAKISEQLAVNATRPQLEAYVSYNGATGDSYGSLSPVNTDLAGIKYPGYNVGLSFAVPIQNRAAKGRLSAARATSRSSELTLRDSEFNIALQARTALRDAEAAKKGVAAAAKTRYFQERNLEAERKKFENGMSTNFVVLQVMTNLDNAKSSELSAQIAYAEAVTTLEVALGNLLEARNFTVK